MRPTAGGPYERVYCNFTSPQPAEPTDPFLDTALGQTPDLTISALGSFASLDNWNTNFDAKPVTLSLLVDFFPVGVPSRQLLWETGGGTVGTSLVYEPGRVLVLRKCGAGGAVVSIVTYKLTWEEIAAGFIPVTATIFASGTGDTVPSTTSLYVNGRLVGSSEQNNGNDWSGSDGADFGRGTSGVCGTGTNDLIPAGPFTAGHISLAHGLRLYGNVAFPITDPCATVSCANGGTCITGRQPYCRCSQDFTGATCEELVKAPGVANECTYPKFGADCEQEMYLPTCHHIKRNYPSAASMAYEISPARNGYVQRTLHHLLSPKHSPPLS